MSKSQSNAKSQTQKVKCKKSKMQKLTPYTQVPLPGHLCPGPTPRFSLSRSHLRPSLFWSHPLLSHLRSSMPRSSLSRCRSPVSVPIPLTGSLSRSHSPVPCPRLPSVPPRSSFPVPLPSSLSRCRPRSRPGPLSRFHSRSSVPNPLPGSLFRSNLRSYVPMPFPGYLSRCRSPVICPGPTLGHLSGLIANLTFCIWLFPVLTFCVWLFANLTFCHLTFSPMTFYPLTYWLLTFCHRIAPDPQNRTSVPPPPRPVDGGKSGVPVGRGLTYQCVTNGKLHRECHP